MAERPRRLVAHTPIEGSDEWHDLADHSLAVARMAAVFAAPFGAEGVAWWMGIFHDLGKAHPDFQEYLWESHIQRPKKQKSVDHKTAGAVKVREIGGEPLTQVLHDLPTDQVAGHLDWWDAAGRVTRLALPGARPVLFDHVQRQERRRRDITCLLMAAR